MNRRPSFCLLDKVVGPCMMAIPSYYYNKESGLCEKFIYGGCLGNKNNFGDLASCVSTCHADVSFFCFLRVYRCIFMKTGKHFHSYWHPYFRTLLRDQAFASWRKLQVPARDMFPVSTMTETVALASGLCTEDVWETRIAS